MNPIAVRSLHLAGVFLAVTCVACSDSSAPRPIEPGAEDQGADMRPMSSREAAGSPHGAAAPSADGEAASSGDSTLPPGHPPIGSMPPDGAASDAASSGAVAGTVKLAPALEGRSQPTDVLYLIARKGGSVVAVRRIESPTFPLAFDISGAHAMTAGTSFEGPLELVARVSHTGDAIAAAGDLEGTTTGVPVPATGVTVTIDTVRQ